MCKDGSQFNDKDESMEEFFGWQERENSYLKEIINALLKTINRLQASNDNDKITVLEAELQTLIRESEEYKGTIFDMQQVIADTTLSFNEKIKALENEIVELKKGAAAGNDSVDMKKESSDEAENDSGFIELKTEGSDEVVKDERFLDLKDVIIDGEIVYEKVNGKILSVNYLYTSDNYCYASYIDDEKEHRVKIKLNNSFKLYLNKNIVHEGGDITNLLKYVHSCSLHSLKLADCNLSFDQFLILVKSETVEYLKLQNVSMQGVNGADVPLEEILGYFPNLKGLMIWCAKQNDDFGGTFCRKETAWYLLNLPFFKRLQTFNLYQCPHIFDLGSFGEFIKKHYWATFRISISVYSHDHPELNAPKEAMDKLRADKDAIMDSWIYPKPEIVFEYEYPNGIRRHTNPYLPRPKPSYEHQRKTFDQFFKL